MSNQSIYNHKTADLYMLYFRIATFIFHVQCTYKFDVLEPTQQLISDRPKKILKERSR